MLALTSRLEWDMWKRARPEAKSLRRRGIRRCWRLCWVGCVGIAFWCPLLGAQEKPQHDGAPATQTSAGEATPRSSEGTEAEREVSWRTLPRNFLQDQKDVWLFPA